MITKLLIMFIKIVRPILGPSQCKFPVTCGTFAILQLQDNSLCMALKNIFKRLLACNPFF